MQQPRFNLTGIGYIGASLIGVIVPFIIDKTGEWKNVFYFLSGITLVVIILIAVLYSVMRRNDAEAVLSR